MAVHKITLIKGYPEYLKQVKAFMDILVPDEGGKIHYITTPSELRLEKNAINIIVCGNTFNNDPLNLHLPQIVTRIREYKTDAIIVGWSTIADEDKIPGLDIFFNTSQNVSDIIGKENFARIQALKLQATALPLSWFLTKSFDFEERQDIIDIMKLPVDWWDVVEFIESQDAKIKFQRYNNT